MRSFVEFVSCCVKNPEVSTTEEVVPAPRREETRSLMAPKMAALRKKNKRVKVGTSFSMTPEWKPSLYAISEDNVMAEKREKMKSEAATTAADRAVKRKSTSGSRSKIHVRSDSGDIRRNPEPMAIPTFSPTPFMF
ncbi:Organic cation/carnitine transporter4 isoform 1 [Hibiscus syriacus]|uniref:Organic cation/carnitine transporter4 isoform 1 n=1 Tax=Hibiscus syriacus TaxID=106335 RepID=A0A6A2Y3I7_HIBSY|nr:uncharacterized protein LOC120167528 [Hibiscus syriacus]KAE8675225.1 Organic cation/carnitine transporter4 isoform 1 [Hibiscus syriacus]